ncbi:radical SAM protein [Clostridium fallax]|uniref:Putative pyruvate formate lyase activating enzyme n=1 Tax=Clostridium fallax TaxID=1533 RepID=A0A1M4T7R6_9CLOT|nr:radical SAM protein [Clostridium fallax]SHE40434.1 putative pyruvate formate lyase activating enzyme [Clostridium fallax]SQB22636.1 radical SAM domain-containing protein [Clostridium fallax]
MNTKEILKSCSLCIRNCKVNRLENHLGFCKSGYSIDVARAALHHWEEPCLSGENGSGTVFFSHCNFRCVFCQNHEISQENKGKPISIERLSEIFLELQEKGAHNINLVTPTHYVPQIIEALIIAKSNGLNLPIVYNTNGYDSLETIKSLKGYIDIYLPDYKYFNEKYAIKYSKAPNYSNNLKELIKEMVLQVGTPKFDENGLMIKGVIIRHLMLPGLLFDSKKVIDDIYINFKDNVFISIMNQYTPMNNASNYPEINKPLNPKHYDSLIDYALSIGVTQGFIQDTGTNTEAYVPNFNNEGV